MYKVPTGPKPLHIRFDKIDGFIRSLDGKIKHLILFDYGFFIKIREKIKYIISKKVVLRMALIIILGKAELIHIIIIIIYLLKIYIDFSCYHIR